MGVTLTLLQLILATLWAVTVYALRVFIITSPSTQTSALLLLAMVSGTLAPILTLYCLYDFVFSTCEFIHRLILIQYLICLIALRIDFPWLFPSNGNWLLDLALWVLYMRVGWQLADLPFQFYADAIAKGEAFQLGHWIRFRLAESCPALVLDFLALGTVLAIAAELKLPFGWILAVLTLLGTTFPYLILHAAPSSLHLPRGQAH